MFKTRSKDTVQQVKTHKMAKNSLFCGFPLR